MADCGVLSSMKRAKTGVKIITKIAFTTPVAMLRAMMSEVAPIAAPVPPPAAQETAAQAAIDDALSKVAPSLVRIHVVSVEHQDGREIKREAAGSGTIISAERPIICSGLKP